MSIADPDFHRLLRFSAALSSACAVVSACAGGDDFSPRTCRADEIAPCACPGDSGAQGTQRCKADGSGFGACGCADGGAGTTGADAGCQSDADCDDGLGCNGAERCVEGSCQAGTPACTNPEPTHCDIACVEDAGVGACHLTAQDKDGDSYLDAACPNADVPGNDCDDADSAIHPSALEICDGKDNDCNGLTDIDDTLTVGGSTIYPVTVTGADGISVAWLAAENAYSVVWNQRTTADEIWFGRYQQDLSPIGTNFKVSSETTYAVNPSSAASSDTFAVVWEQGVLNPVGTAQVKFQSIKAGSLATTEKVVGAGRIPDLTTHSTNGWVVVWNDDQTPASINMSHLDVTGATLSTKGVDYADSYSRMPSVARVGTTIGIAYVGGTTTRVVKFARLGEDANGNISTDTVGPVDTNNPQIPRVAIGANDSFFAIAWTELTSTAPTTYFSKYDAQGALVCGPKPIVSGVSALISDVLPYGDGFAMLATRGNNNPVDLVLVRVSATCEPLPKSPQPLDGLSPVSIPNPSLPVLAHGSAGWLGAWDEFISASQGRVAIRSFGPYFCD